MLDLDKPFSSKTFILFNNDLENVLLPTLGSDTLIYVRQTKSAEGGFEPPTLLANRACAVPTGLFDSTIAMYRYRYVLKS